ncbi:hypothetical protein CI102_9263 [Trichoderma harzianum]|nr:hypothetical protein CI102_9263 [Trichoderma harzianum]
MPVLLFAHLLHLDRPLPYFLSAQFTVERFIPGPDDCRLAITGKVWLLRPAPGKSLSSSRVSAGRLIRNVQRCVCDYRPCFTLLPSASIIHSLDSAIATAVATPMRMHRQKLGRSKRCEGDVDARGRLMIKTIWDANEESRWLHHSLVHRQSDMHFMQPRYATSTLTRNQSICRTVARLSVLPIYLLSLYGDNNETMDLASLCGKSYLPLQDMTFLEHSPTFRRDDFDFLGRITQAAIIGRIVTEVDTLQAILISCTKLTGPAFPKIRGLTWSLPPPPASCLFPRGGGADFVIAWENLPRVPGLMLIY